MPQPEVQRQPESRQDRAWRHLILPAALAVVLPAILFFAVLFAHATGLPCEDDYNAILRFTTQHVQLGTAGAKLLHIAAYQHNEYKFVLHDVLAIVDRDVEGRVDFRTLATLANLGMVAVAWLLFQVSLPRTLPLGLRLVLLVPVSWLLFTLNAAQVWNFATCGLQIVPSLFFGLLALTLLAREPARLRNTALAGACGLCATMASASGFPLAAAGLLFLLVRLPMRRMVAHAAVWCGCFLPAVAIYSYHYQRQPHATVKNAKVMVLFGLSFLGSAAPGVWLAGPLGLGILLVLALALRRGFGRACPVPCSLAVWIVLTAMLAAWSRAGFGWYAALSTRYQINCNLLLAVAYVALLFLFMPALFTAGADARGFRRWLYAALLVLAVVASVGWDRRGVRLEREQQTRLTAGMRQFLADPARNSPMLWQDPFVEMQERDEEELERRLLMQAIAAGVYTPPPEASLQP